MKKLITNLSLSLFLSMGAAQANSVYAYKYGIVSELALETTVEMQGSRHENVEIDLLALEEEQLLNILTSVQDTAISKLTSEKLNSIKTCISLNFCDVFILDITSSFHSGWSQTYKYYLMNDNMNSEIIEQTLQAE